MTTLVHANLLDLGFSYANTTSLSFTVCQSEPLNFNDCSLLSGSGGKRIADTIVLSAGEITLTDGINANSRSLTIPGRTLPDGVQVGVTQGSSDLWLVVYDGSNWLIKTNEIQNIELLLGATVVSPAFTWGVQQ